MDPVSAALELPLARIGDDGTGRVADYIPELAAAMSGRVYAAGDAGVAALTALSQEYGLHRSGPDPPGGLLTADASPGAVVLLIGEQAAGQQFRELGDLRGHLLAGELLPQERATQPPAKQRRTGTHGRVTHRSARRCRQPQTYGCAVPLVPPP